jgi:hypothetical protein
MLDHLAEQQHDTLSPSQCESAEQIVFVLEAFYETTFLGKTRTPLVVMLNGKLRTSDVDVQQKMTASNN